MEPLLSVYAGTSIVQTAQTNYVVCSQLPVLKFWLDRSSKEEAYRVLFTCWVGINNGLGTKDPRDH